MIELYGTETPIESYLFFLSSYKNGNECDDGWGDWVTHSVGPQTIWPHAQWTSITNKKWFQLFQIHHFTHNIVRRAYFVLSPFIWHPSRAYRIFASIILLSEWAPSSAVQKRQTGSQWMWREIIIWEHQSSIVCNHGFLVLETELFHFVVYFSFTSHRKPLSFLTLITIIRKRAFRFGTRPLL